MHIQVNINNIVFVGMVLSDLQLKITHTHIVYIYIYKKLILHSIIV